MAELRIWGVAGMPEVLPGDDLAGLIVAGQPELADGDVVVVTSKVVSKAEGRLVRGDRESAIDAETVRVVARRGPMRIVETRQGLVLAAAGVDASNVEPGRVALLPADPDGSARRLRAGLRDRLGVDVAVVISDTLGRAWRDGVIDAAIGCAGLAPLDDHRGRRDPHGTVLTATVTAVADEVASAAELVKGKLDDVPVAVVRGLDRPRPGAGGDGPGARAINRAARDDLFPLGTAEARASGMRAGRRQAMLAGALIATAAGIAVRRTGR
jgi:coenzyme F420-0:L-glutamate ligase/coenzyme F420-1:gamma-L-glutamate ligase